MVSAFFRSVYIIDATATLLKLRQLAYNSNMSRTVLSIIESALSPNCESLYQQLGYRETRISSMRKALSSIKKTRYDYIVCEFLYRYGTDYAGCTVSNLDVLLATLQKYSPDTKVVVIADKSEQEYVSKLTDQFDVHEVLIYQNSNMADIQRAVTT